MADDPHRGKLQASLARKSADPARLARKVMREPALLPEVLDGLGAQPAAVKYGCAKILRLVAGQAPELLYPHFRFFVDLLDNDNKIMQWESIHVLGYLASVGTKRRVERILERYLAPLPGPVLITAANVIGGAARIACAKPRLADRIAVALLGVQRARYKTPECRNVALGATVEALDQMFEHLREPEPVLRFVRRQLKNTRPATRKKAERFLARRDRE